MRLWKDCSFFHEEDNILRCTYPKHRKEFDGTFQCEGKCFRHRKDKIKGKNEIDDLMTNGADHTL